MSSEAHSEPATLSSHDFFKGLSAPRLSALEQRSKIRDFPSGHIFFKTNETGELFFLLEQGAIQTYRTSAGKKLIVAELKPPAVFGEMGCVGQCKYHCTAQATVPSRVRVFSRADIDALLDQHPIITRRLLDLVSERFLTSLWTWTPPLSRI